MAEEALYLNQVLGGRHRIVSLLGAGNFSLVFEAIDQTSGATVAVKVLRINVPSTGVLEFETEGRLLQMLRAASNVVDLVGPTSQSCQIPITTASGVQVPLPVRYLVLEIAECALADIVARRHSLRWRDRLDLFRDVTKGVHQMHLNGIVHRDLKSDNALMVRESGVGAVAKVADLGRSRNIAEDARFAADDYIAGRGDLRFAPPELLWLCGSEDGACYRRADLYLLGSVLFEFATGQGITGLAISDHQRVLQHAATIDQSARSREYTARVAQLRATYAPAIELFRNEMPPSIRQDATRLLVQLCDPEPARREHRQRADKAHPLWGLNWLLRRTDILARRLRLAERTESENKMRKAANGSGAA